MSEAAPLVSSKPRLLWIDVAKGIGILWVVYFHFATNYLDLDAHPEVPSPTSGHFFQTVAGEHGWDSLWEAFLTVCRGVGLEISLMGFHAVGLFVLLGGWSLAATTWRKAERGPVRWGNWLKQRLMRLFPMYWTAHLVFLLLPFTWLEPIDGRFLISLTGLRWIRIESNFLYENAAWWYFAMLLELYAIFPLLFWAMRRMGLVVFVVLGMTVGLVTRELLLVQWEAHGFWLLGGNCLSRTPEFVLGMALGILHLRHKEKVESLILGWPALLAGLVMYFFVSVVHGTAFSYVFADLYTAVSCSLVVLGASGLIQKSAFSSKWIGLVGTYSLGLYLIHQPLVTWLGQRIKTVGVGAFLVISAGVLVLLSGFGIWLERRVNALTERVLAKA